jgi:hypothetical protein
VSKTWRFIFVRQPKSSSTAVLRGIESQFCKTGGNKTRCTPDELARMHTVSEEQWRDYFVFTVIRNPWIRMLSAHKMFTTHFLRQCAPFGKLLIGQACCTHCMQGDCAHTRVVLHVWLYRSSHPLKAVLTNQVLHGPSREMCNPALYHWATIPSNGGTNFFLLWPQVQARAFHAGGSPRVATSRDTSVVTPFSSSL